MLYDPITVISGIGESKAKLFEKLGIKTVGDLLAYYPSDYQDRTTIKKISELQDGETVCVCGFPASKPSNFRRGGRSIQKVFVMDDSGSRIAMTWFNQPYLSDNLDPEKEYVFYGKATLKGTRAEMSGATFERLEDNRFTRKIMPIYRLTKQVGQKMLQDAIQKAIVNVNHIKENLPEWLIEKYSLCGLQYAVKNIHLPDDYNAFQSARNRLVFDELLSLHLSVRSIKAKRMTQRGTPLKSHAGLGDFVKNLPFELTDAQKKVAREITDDLAKAVPMCRLVQGDVGSGKTIIAAIAIYITGQNNMQSAMMVPTEILAEQHFETLSALFKNVVLLKGSMKQSDKKAVYEKILSGEAKVIIGTHALIQDSVQFKNLGLIITDEQHRFGTLQRYRLEKKGDSPHVLVMSATPIPRTLALILYGDLDISIIDQLPPGRKKIETYAVNESFRERINRFMRNQLDEGRQAYIVCPLIEENDENEIKSAVQFAEILQSGVFHKYKVALIHGRMPPKKKDEIMKSFSHGEIHILVSTTVIEVGVNVPNASIMVIENAERFGLAQLHQLRGRVGRGKHQSYCVLFVQGGNEITEERMNVMTQTNDGFVISEKDLLLRGPGDFFGVKQHGLPEMRIANLYTDMAMLKTTSKAADDLIKSGDINIEKIRNILYTS